MCIKNFWCVFGAWKPCIAKIIKGGTILNCFLDMVADKNLYCSPSVYKVVLAILIGIIILMHFRLTKFIVRTVYKEKYMLKPF
jgi:hypothetical protein